MNQLIRLITAIAALSFGISLSANAETLVAYTFSSGSSPDSSGSNVQTQAATYGSPSDSSLVNRSGSGNIYYELSAAGSSDSESTAFSNNMYSQFTLAPESGYQIDFTNLSFKYSGTSSSGYTYTANFFIRSSVDNYTTNLETLTTAVAAGATTPTYPTAVSVDLSEFGNIASSTTFRIYAYITDLSPSFSGSDRPRIDDVTITGDLTVIPEASHASLLFGGLAISFIALSRRGRSIHS